MNTQKLSEQRIRRILSVLPEALEKASRGETPDPTFNESLEHLLADYYRLMEVAHLVRCGGVNAMIYRLETGCVELQPGDYLDESADKLAQSYPAHVNFPNHTEHSMLEFLKSVAAEEESAVKNSIGYIDEFLLADARQIATEELVNDEAPGS